MIVILVLLAPTLVYLAVLLSVPRFLSSKHSPNRLLNLRLRTGLSTLLLGGVTEVAIGLSVFPGDAQSLIPLKPVLLLAFGVMLLVNIVVLAVNTRKLVIKKRRDALR